MPKIPQIKPRQFVRVLERLGFLFVRQRGSHASFHHPDGRTVIVPMHPGDIPSGTLRGMLTDIHVTVESLRENL